MTTTAKTRHSDGLRRGGLDWNVPQDGKAADAYEVACTAAYLMRTPRCDGGRDFQPARHATRLHVISGRLWNIATREANGYRFQTVEQLVHGGVTIDAPAQVRDQKLRASLEADASEIAAHYGLECSFGGLVDGGLVIGTPEQLNRVDPERHGHVIRRLS